MSEKNEKKVKIPVYSIEKQMDFIVSVCEDYDFNPQTLITLIFADWICTFQELTSKVSGNSYQSFVSYLKSTEKTYDKLNQIREYIENGNGKAK